MSFSYTVREVHKDHILVEYDNGNLMPIPVNTWVDRDWIEDQIIEYYREEDLGEVADIPFEVGDTATLETRQERENAAKTSATDAKNAFDNATFDYKVIRRIEYPWIMDTVGALVKAVMTGDKSELEALDTIIQAVKTKYPKDPTIQYNRTQINTAFENAPIRQHRQVNDIAHPGS